MRNSIIGIVIMLMALNGFAAKDKEDEVKKDKVEKICNQGILLQRMVKDFMMMGIDLQKKESQMDLDECVADYEMTRLFFEDIEADEKTMSAIEKADEKWVRFRMEVTDKVTPENAYELFKTNESLLNTNEQLLQSSCQGCDLNSISGYLLSKELEMLSERIAMLYFAHSWGIKKEVSLRYFSDAVRNFEMKLNQLKSLKNMNAQIESKLMTLEFEWQNAKQLFGRMNFGKHENKAVYEACLSFSKSFNSVGAMYFDQSEKDKITGQSPTSPN
ncbi:MAG: hypothetical protein GXO89_05450 [Chlorobi bacterium]|nr:hypothetical protein [Chlorobiota bacterium]